MSRNEKATCRELIEPALRNLGWTWDAQMRIGPGRVNMTGERMYDETQAIIADYLLRYQGIPLAILEAKAESEDAADGIQQSQRYAQRLDLRFALASNGREWFLADRNSGELERLSQAPEPAEILQRMGQKPGNKWERAFEAPWFVDQITRKHVRPYQEIAIAKTLLHFGQGHSRALLLMATGTGKTMTVFQLVWKLFQSDSLPRGHVLFLTDRNSLKDQAYRAFSAFSADERVVIDKACVAEQRHSVGKVFFTNYQNLDEELEGKKVYQHFAADFFDLVVVDECHRSGFGDWFGVLEHFHSAYQLGLTATPRELDDAKRILTDEEKRRDTFAYFGEPIFTYTLRQAIEDGYLVPYLLEERITNLDKEGYTATDGAVYTTETFEREIRMPDRTRAIAEDLWKVLNQYGLQNEKTIVFCVDDTHAALMAA
ncbi:MAG TPA: DEAD/DEAH box helicase family protein, partial [Fibrobacteraceae bacterium]|nr:DEAD/DEAH box helicase family protein [Fibrobacteraceae bacterium]